MVRVLFFAGLREALGSSESLAWSPAIATAGALREHLAARGGAWEMLTTTRNLRVAVNQTMGSSDSAVSDGDEVAFFPPVTGG